MNNINNEQNEDVPVLIPIDVPEQILIEFIWSSYRYGYRYKIVINEPTEHLKD